MSSLVNKRGPSVAFRELLEFALSCSVLALYRRSNSRIWEKLLQTLSPHASYHREVKRILVKAGNKKGTSLRLLPLPAPELVIQLCIVMRSPSRLLEATATQWGLLLRFRLSLFLSFSLPFLFHFICWMTHFFPFLGRSLSPSVRDSLCSSLRDADYNVVNYICAYISPSSLFAFAHSHLLLKEETGCHFNIATRSVEKRLCLCFCRA